MPAVKLEDARRVTRAAESKAVEIGQPMNIAVADEGGNIVSHVRMDGAWIGSIDVAMKKAYTSRAFDIETNNLAKHAQSGGEFFGRRRQNHDLCGWNSVETRWQSDRRHWCERRFWRPGSACCRGRCRRVLTMTEY